MKLTEEQVAELQARVVDGSRSTMRRVIGDRTPAQYDRADKMAEAISFAVGQALVDMGLRPVQA